MMILSLGISIFTSSLTMAATTLGWVGTRGHWQFTLMPTVSPVLHEEKRETGHPSSFPPPEGQRMGIRLKDKKI
jgi:hypothetical protein